MGGVRFNLLLLLFFVRLSIIITLVFVGECAAVGSRGDGRMDWLCDVNVGGYGVYLYWDSEVAVVVVVVAIV